MNFLICPWASGCSARSFQFVTPRTAGFNTVDLTTISEVGLLLMILLMLIGGSPGSTAGGMKTTTIAVLFSSSLAVFRQKGSAHYFGRRIPDEAIRNAGTVLLMYLTLFLAGGMFISYVENIPVLLALFVNGVCHWYRRSLSGDFFFFLAGHFNIF